jgi:surface antigen
MKLQKIILLVVLGVSLMACSKSDDQEHFLSGQQRALERAQDVDNVIQQAEEKKRQQLENMER